MQKSQTWITDELSSVELDILLCTRVSQFKLLNLAETQHQDWLCVNLLKENGFKRKRGGCGKSINNGSVAILRNFKIRRIILHLSLLLNLMPRFQHAI